MVKRNAAPLLSSLTIRVDGTSLSAAPGDSIAIAVVASGRLLFGRSVKYHRPRGPHCFRGRCEGCLMRVDGVPNVMTCRTPAREGQIVESQNVLGSARRDLLAVTDWFTPHGIDHHHMFTRFGPVNRLMKKVARQVAGVGRVPAQALGPVSFRDTRADVLVVGAGRAGIAAANEAARRGASVLLVEEHEAASAVLGPPVVLRRAVALAVYDEEAHGFARSVSTGLRRWVLLGDAAGLIRVEVRSLVVAAGAPPTGLAIPGVDLPGVLAPSGLHALLGAGLRPEGAVALVGEAATLRPLADELRVHGIPALGPVEPERVGRIAGRPEVDGIVIDGTEAPCELVVVAGPSSAAFELAAQGGAEVCFSGTGFVVLAGEEGETADPRTYAVGACSGRRGPAAEAQARAAGRRAAGAPS